jgi:hypothetical protein
MNPFTTQHQHQHQHQPDVDLDLDLDMHIDVIAASSYNDNCASPLTQTLTPVRLSSNKNISASALSHRSSVPGPGEYFVSSRASSRQQQRSRALPPPSSSTAAADYPRNHPMAKKWVQDLATKRGVAVLPPPDLRPASSSSSSMSSLPAVSRPIHEQFSAQAACGGGDARPLVVPRLNNAALPTLDGNVNARPHPHAYPNHQQQQQHQRQQPRFNAIPLYARPPPSHPPVSVPSQHGTLVGYHYHHHYHQHQQQQSPHVDRYPDPSPPPLRRASVQERVVRSLLPPPIFHECPHRRSQRKTCRAST